MGQPKIPPTSPDTSLSGKTAIITGGNTGHGLEAARQFLTLGAARIILACRSLARGVEAVTTLRADPVVSKTNPDAVIDVLELDLDDYQSGLRFSQRVKYEIPELDILLNNGGLVVMKYENSKSGHERVMQVNCYTHILVCLELLPLLRSTAAQRSSPTRISFTGSGMHATKPTIPDTPIASTTPVLAHLNGKATFGVSSYADSKLAVAAYVRKLAAIAPEAVIVNHFCPGLDKNLPFLLKTGMAVVRKVFSRTVEEGARTMVYAVAVAGKESNGKFLQHNAIARGSAWLDEKAEQEFTDKLWKETVRDIGAVDPALGSFVEVPGLTWKLTQVCTVTWRVSDYQVAT